jgi:hypothetical protein
MDALTKLKAKQLSLVDLAELFFKAEDASKYTERFHTKIEGYIQCEKWANKIDACVKSITIVQQEMRALLEKEGGFKVVGGE